MLGKRVSRETSGEDVEERYGTRHKEAVKEVPHHRHEPEKVLVRL